MSRQIVLIEDEDRLRELICLHFAVDGAACEAFSDAGSAIAYLNQRRADLVVVDLGTAHGSCLAFCERLHRAVVRGTPIVLLARDSNDDVVAALERYVDDFIVKPLRVPELVARGRALMRRANGRLQGEGTPIALGNLIVDHARRRVEIDGVVVTMTEQEFRLLFTLASRSGVVFSRRDLLYEIWGPGTFVTTRSVDSLVMRVRRRIHTVAASDPHIATVRGVGYKLDALTSRSR